MERTVCQQCWPLAGQAANPQWTWQVSCPPGSQHNFPLAEPKWKAKSRQAGDADCICQSQDRWQARSRVSGLSGRVLKAVGSRQVLIPTTSWDIARFLSAALVFTGSSAQTHWHQGLSTCYSCHLNKPSCFVNSDVCFSSKPHHHILGENNVPGQTSGAITVCHSTL